jgi:hypothetical protein
LNATGTALDRFGKDRRQRDDGVNIQAKYLQNGPESINRNYGDDARSEVILDNAGNIYMASCTQSTDFPVTQLFPNNNRAGKEAKAGSRMQWC